MANNKDNKAFDMMKSGSSSDEKHITLALAGMVPGPTGVAADIANAALYAKEKKWKDTGWSLIGAIPLIGQISSAKKIANITKSIELTTRLKRMAKYERMKEGIESGSLLFSNKKLQKALDKGDMWIDKSGDIISSVGGKGAGMVTGNIYKMPKYERYSDYYELMNDVSKDMIKAYKNLSPEQKSIAKSLGKSPTLKKRLKDTVLKLEKLLPSD